MDMNLVPLRIELRVILKLQIKIKIWGKSWSRTWTIINHLLWHYQSRMINKNIFKINDPEPDPTPALFDVYPAGKQVTSQKITLVELPRINYKSLESYFLYLFFLV